MFDSLSPSTIEFFKGSAFPIISALCGGGIYALFKLFKHSLSHIEEKEFILIMFDIVALISAVKIILLSTNMKIPLDTYFDRTYLAVAGGVTVVITIKDIVSKFQ